MSLTSLQTPTSPHSIYSPVSPKQLLSSDKEDKCSSPEKVSITPKNTLYDEALTNPNLPEKVHKSNEHFLA